MNTYEQDFPFYLKYTNEKKILSKEILNLFNRFNVKSVLDLGAGNGDLSKLLVKDVDRYLAVEPKKEFIHSLRKEGITALEKAFPCNLSEEKYDFILCSHSVPSSKLDYEPFLNKAFERLNQNGHLLIITYLGKENDWDNLLTDIKVKPFEEVSDRYFERKDFLKKLGKIEEWFVFSKVESSSIENIIKALSFVASGGEVEKKNIFLSKSKEISDIMNQKYYNKESNDYFFPFEHVFLMTSKRT
jgi:SAM-dependent methyltransferase